MNDRPTDREQQLIELAKRLSESSDSSEANVERKLLAASDWLDDDERLALRRVQNALEFIQDAKPKGNTSDVRNGETEAPLPAKRCPEPPRYPELKPGGRLGRFELVRVLGSGGFATVWLARDPAIDRQIALKVLHARRFGAGDALDRFGREAKAAGTLSHPGIVPVFDTGVQSGTPYIAYEFCAGETLEAWIDGHEAISPEQAARILIRLAEAAGHAHQRGVIHRDLKPANIMMEEHSNPADGNDKAYPRITDFGLAKYSQIVDQFETASGAILGTPAYMAPEQTHSDAFINESADIYSLGAILYQLLTGSVPHCKSSHLDTLLAIRNDPIRSPRSRRSSIPRDLDAICMKCLSRSPGRRYESAFDLREDLVRWINGEPVAARIPSRPEKAFYWCARNPVITALLLLISCALGLAAWQWRSAVIENGRAERHLATTQSTISELVARIADNEAIPGDLRTEIAERAVEMQLALLQEEPDSTLVAERTSTALDQLTRLLFDLMEYEQALEHNARRIEVLQRFQSEPFADEHLFEAKQLQAGIQRGMGRLEEAQSMVDDLESTSLPNGKKLELARAGFQRGMNLLAQNQALDEAADAFRDAIEIYQALVEAPPNELARCCHFLGSVLMNQDKLEQAFDTTERAARLVEVEIASAPHHAELQEDLARCLVQLGQIRSGQEKLETGDMREAYIRDARSFYQQAAETYQTLLDGDLPNARIPASLAVTFDLAIQMEVRLKDADRADSLIGMYEAFFSALDHDAYAHATIGRILADRKLDWAELVAISDPYAAERTTAECDALLDLLEMLPETDAKLELTRKRCDTMMDDP